MGNGTNDGLAVTEVRGAFLLQIGVLTLSLSPSPSLPRPQVFPLPLLPALSPLHHCFLLTPPPPLPSPSPSFSPPSYGSLPGGHWSVHGAVRY